MAGVGAYAYLNARLRAKLGKLVTAEQYEQLLAAADIEAAYDVLRHTEYADIFKESGSAQDLHRAESALVDRLIWCHREVAVHSKGAVRRFVEELMRKYEVENLKVILRVWNAGEDGRFICRDQICYKIPIDPMLQAETIEEVILLLEDTPYRKPLAEARERFKKTDSLFYLEIALDRELYQATWNAIGRLCTSDRRIASKLLGIEIDILNINWILRFKRYYNLALAEIIKLMLPRGLQITEALVREVYPGRDQASLMTALLIGVYRKTLQSIRTEQETEALHLLEGLLRELYIHQVKGALTGYPFTIGVVIAYLRLKKLDVSNIVTILNAKTLKVPAEEARRNIVEV